ncbi:hypothetical protein E2C01_031923 [Portunus trituberculatus]|uniref:Uncharacterized protein n=1 Tax=Portunus trituberculatus TaxID=210409 RepID=A0A5B7EYZ0_PORTR|nr:hypothetical protein [Portunus trituberculatus]
MGVMKAAYPPVSTSEPHSRAGLPCNKAIRYPHFSNITTVLDTTAAQPVSLVKIAKERRKIRENPSKSLQEFSQWIVERIGSSLMNSLEVGAFFLQFLEWFYTSNTTPRSIIAQPIPPPPQTCYLSLVTSNLTFSPPGHYMVKSSVTSQSHQQRKRTNVSVLFCGRLFHLLGTKNPSNNFLWLALLPQIDNCEPDFS